MITYTQISFQSIKSTVIQHLCNYKNNDWNGLVINDDSSLPYGRSKIINVISIEIDPKTISTEKWTVSGRNGRFEFETTVHF